MWKLMNCCMSNACPWPPPSQNQHYPRDVLYQQQRLKGNRDASEGIVSESVVNECLPYGNRMKCLGRKTE